MDKHYTKGTVTNFLLKNWFNLGVIIFLLYISFQKDFSFQINLNDPVRMEKESSKAAPNKDQATNNTSGKYSEIQNTPSLAEVNPGTIDRFDFSGLGSGKNKPKSPMAALKTIDQETKSKFLKRFTHVAVSERKKFGIPSSVILANALLHSFSGKRNMAFKGNNHFAVPCTPDWHGETGTYSGKCFRHYENAWTSFRDHSRFITTGRFQSLRGLSPQDYKAWAYELERLGYSEEPDLGNNLVRIIEEYKLYDLDGR